MRMLRYILCLIMLMLAASALTSCQDSDPKDEPLPDGETCIVMQLTVSNTAAGTRATPTDGEYNRGEGYENYIDIPGLNFRFYLFDADNKLIAPIEIGQIIPLESTSTSKTYQVRSFGSDRRFDGRQLKVVALANWPSYPTDEELIEGETTIDQLVSRQFEFSAESMELSEDTTIPMYGVTNLMTLRYDDFNNADMGLLHLLRAYAKVEVILSDDCVYSISSMAMTRYNSRGYCAPQKVYIQDHYVHNTYERDYLSTPSTVAGCEVQQDLPFIKVTPKRWIAYVPEYRNLDASGNARPDNELAKIKIEFKGKDVTEDRYDYLYFATYRNNETPNLPDRHFNILRNVWYRFTINKESAPLVQVIPYNEVDLNPLFGLLLGKEFIPIYDDQGLIRYWYDPESGKYYGTDRITEIENPYVNVLMPEGWTIIRDLNDNIIGYFDPETGQYYDVDKNKVDQLNIDAATGWEIIVDDDGAVIGYYDRKNDKYYDIDKKTELPNKPGE